MHDPLDYEIESLIETLEPQMIGAIAIVKADDWVHLEFDSEKEATQKLHFSLTDRHVNYAIQLQTLALVGDCVNHPRVVEMMEKLMEFYDICKDRYNKYFEIQNESILDMIATKGKSSVSESGEKKRNTRVKSLSLAEVEVKFSSELTASMQKLAVKVKKLKDTTNPDKINIPTFNDTPIPLAMHISVEDQFPKVKEILERRQNETTSTPDIPD